uniref:Uncharacterized protein n=1 Tax=Leersia perrieri TaxID=77586 RepID=A0A0D9XH57_9ORYZ
MVQAGSAMMVMATIILLVSSTSWSVAALGTRVPDFFVEGSVYCDTCRAGFETNATTAIKGARVRLECRHYMSASGAVERSVEGTTDAAGKYRIELLDNRGAEEPLPGCRETEAGRDRAPVTLVHDASLATMLRRANPLGFLKDHPLPICGHLLRSYALSTAPSY